MKIEELIKELGKYPKGRNVILDITSVSSTSSTFVNVLANIEEVRSNGESVTIKGLNNPERIRK